MLKKKKSCSLPDIFCSISSPACGEEARGFIREIWRPTLSAWGHAGGGRGSIPNRTPVSPLETGRAPLGSPRPTSCFCGWARKNQLRSPLNNLLLLFFLLLCLAFKLSLFLPSFPFSVDLMNDSFNPSPPPTPPNSSPFHPTTQLTTFPSLALYFLSVLLFYCK